METKLLNTLKKICNNSFQVTLDINDIIGIADTNKLAELEELLKEAITDSYEYEDIRCLLEDELSKQELKDILDYLGYEEESEEE